MMWRREQNKFTLAENINMKLWVVGRSAFIRENGHFSNLKFYYREEKKRNKIKKRKIKIKKKKEGGSRGRRRKTKEERGGLLRSTRVDSCQGIGKDKKGKMKAGDDVKKKKKESWLIWNVRVTYPLYPLPLVGVREIPIQNLSRHRQLFFSFFFFHNPSTTINSCPPREPLSLVLSFSPSLESPSLFFFFFFFLFLFTITNFQITKMTLLPSPK